MKLIVGLGNPGKKYEKTRHNIGYMAAEALALEYNLKFSECRKTNTAKTKGVIGKQTVILAKPRTFMNESGQPVKKLADFYKIKFRDIWIIYDDLDLPLGKIRIRQNGSTGGHKGLTSVINHLNTPFFNRLRLGIGSNREKNIPAETHVLQKFTAQEMNIVQQAIKEALIKLKENL